VNVIQPELLYGQERAIRFIEMFIASRYTGPVTVGTRRRLEFTARPTSGEFEK